MTTEPARVKLPKQWKHWCKVNNLRPHKPKGWASQTHDWFYLKGQGRHWRVNCYSEFECGDTYAEFDRWAMCTIASTSLPQTQLEFTQVVAKLIAEHSSYVEE